MIDTTTRLITLKIIWCIQYEDMRVLTKDKDVTNKWKEYLKDY